MHITWSNDDCSFMQYRHHDCSWMHIYASPPSVISSHHDRLYRCMYICISHPQSVTFIIWRFDSVLKCTSQFMFGIHSSALSGFKWDGRQSLTRGKIKLPQDKITTDILQKYIFTNDKFCISIWISLKFVAKYPIHNKPALVLVMAWHHTGDRPLTESMLTQFTDEICGTRGRWVDKCIMQSITVHVVGVALDIHIMYLGKKPLHVIYWLLCRQGDI